MDRMPLIYSLLLLTSCCLLLSGCSPETKITDKTKWLCEHGQHVEPDPNAVPDGEDLAAYVAPEDLDLLKLGTNVPLSGEAYGDGAADGDSTNQPVDCVREDFEPVNNGFHHTDALLEDKADVATLVFYNFEVLEARHRGHGADFFALKDWGIPDFCQLIMITHPDTLEDRHDTVATFVDLLRKSIDFLHQPPRRARQIYFEETDPDVDSPLMNAIFDATVPCFTYDQQMTADYYADLSFWMKRTELIESTEQPSSYWTNELV